MSEAPTPNFGPATDLRSALLLPLHITGLALICTYALAVRGVQLATAGDPIQVFFVVGFSLPIWYTVAGALCLYAQKLLLHTASGLGDERLDNATDLNPFQRPMAPRLMFLIALVFIALLINGRDLNSVGMLIVALIFPLLWIGLALEESFTTALHPARTWRTLIGLGPLLPVVIATLSLSVGLIAYATLFLRDLFILLGAGYVLLLAHLLTGQILYWRRSNLYLRTAKSPEQTRTTELMAETKALDNFIHELHRFCMGGHFADAVARLETYIGDQPEALDPVIHERLLNFQDRRLTLEHALQYLHRLAARGESRKAWALLKWSVNEDECFRPMDGATLLDLTRAAGPEDAGLVNLLLADFAAAYPDSKQIPEAMFRRARVCIERLKDSETGLALLRAIAIEHPEFATSDAFLRYRGRLKPH